MPLQRTDIIERANVLAGLSGDFEFRISKPATEKNVSWRQKQINRPIPKEISDLATHTASQIFIKWELDPNKVPDVEFEREVQGVGSFEFNFFKTDLSGLDGWEDSFTNWKDYREEPNPFGYEDIFPVFDVGNGDILVAMIGGSDKGAIYYLDHDGGDGDWRRLADSYDQFIVTLAQLWFPALDWYGSLENFYDEDRRIVSADSSLARQFDAFIRHKD
jgi:hypothetical protein